MNKLLPAILPLLICASVGCGSSNPWDPVEVTGKITYEDDSVIPGGARLYFMPQTPPLDAKTFPRQGVVDINAADGTFEYVTTYKYADGLIPGKHKVVVSAGSRGGSASSAVPKVYSSVTTTPLEIDTADSPLHIKIRKP